MKLWQCETHGYVIRATCEVISQHPGKLDVVTGIVHLGGRNVAEDVPLDAIQGSVCMECGEPLAVVEIEVCPHVTDAQYWEEKLGDNRPVRVCQLCGVRQAGVYVPVWPE